MPNSRHLAFIPGPLSELAVWPQPEGQLLTTASCSQSGVSVPALCDCAGLQIGSGLWVELHSACYGLTCIGQIVPEIFILEKASQCLL